MKFILKSLIISVIFITHTSVAAVTKLPQLPEPVSNNAVTKVTTSQGEYLLSFMGLSAKKDHRAVHNKVWALKLAQQDSGKSWQSKKPVPGSLNLKGRLASVATSIGGYAYIFGGYTVSADHQEVSSPDVYSYDVVSDKYTQLMSMPVPVDDSVALSYKNRYIYLVSGWHNDGNVNLVQVYDTHKNSWQQASPFLGQPVFGQAAAISDNIIVVCDGVSVVAHKNKRRSYAGIAQCLKGTIATDNPYKIDWRVISHPTGKARYRMAATALDHKIIMLAGSGNPYNYNGIGYDGVPSPASSELWIYDIKTAQWQIKKSASKMTMDHRGLLLHDNKLITLGGMNNRQQVIAEVISRDVDF